MCSIGIDEARPGLHVLCVTPAPSPPKQRACPQGSRALIGWAILSVPAQVFLLCTYLLQCAFLSCCCTSKIICGPTTLDEA